MILYASVAKTKSGKDRKIPVLGPLEPILNAYYLCADKPADRLFLVASTAKSPESFFTADWVSRCFRQAWAQVHPELPAMRWHDLRKSCGAMLIRDYKMSLEHTSVFLGHAKVTTTQQYYVDLIDQTQKDLERYAGLFCD